MLLRVLMLWAGWRLLRRLAGAALIAGADLSCDRRDPLSHRSATPRRQRDRPATALGTAASHRGPARIGKRARGRREPSPPLDPAGGFTSSAPRARERSIAHRAVLASAGRRRDLWVWFEVLVLLGCRQLVGKSSLVSLSRCSRSRHERRLGTGGRWRSNGTASGRRSSLIGDRSVCAHAGAGPAGMSSPSFRSSLAFSVIAA